MKSLYLIFFLLLCFTNGQLAMAAEELLHDFDADGVLERIVLVENKLEIQFRNADTGAWECCGP